MWSLTNLQMNVDSSSVSTYTLQDSSVSMFDRLSSLITDSLLCGCPNFGDYPITICVPTNKGTSLPFSNWNGEQSHTQRRGRPITENYWIEEWNKDVWSALGCLWNFLRFHQEQKKKKKDGWGDPPGQHPAGVCRRASLPPPKKKRITLRLCNPSSASDLLLNNPSARPPWGMTSFFF